MTAQVAERLRYQGLEVPLFTQPLSDYFSSIGIRPRFLVRMTCLWRGYAAPGRSPMGVVVATRVRHNGNRTS